MKNISNNLSICASCLHGRQIRTFRGCHYFAGRFPYVLRSAEFYWFMNYPITVINTPSLLFVIFFGLVRCLIHHTLVWSSIFQWCVNLLRCNGVLHFETADKPNTFLLPHLVFSIRICMSLRFHSPFLVCPPPHLNLHSHFLTRKLCYPFSCCISISLTHALFPVLFVRIHRPAHFFPCLLPPLIPVCWMLTC